ncbi:hypothetical protein GPECTOR_19g272 [Gonium pectorale]|uniref:Uncharacterized protein n=1 Tax=Gonium pectorale TaxID=33097 RepID=A0A150GJ29_GONPE|nr:hypothetical protein GPECTOR_19g272 [Gonium pectorale]|eukprot:KXZ49821.1 hypothetical protein GPECTOR_19g272 [Gonium pectorale]
MMCRNQAARGAAPLPALLQLLVAALLLSGTALAALRDDEPLTGTAVRATADSAGPQQPKAVVKVGEDAPAEGASARRKLLTGGTGVTWSYTASWRGKEVEGKGSAGGKAKASPPKAPPKSPPKAPPKAPAAKPPTIIINVNNVNDGTRTTTTVDQAVIPGGGAKPPVAKPSKR